MKKNKPKTTKLKRNLPSKKVKSKEGVRIDRFRPAMQARKRPSPKNRRKIQHLRSPKREILVQRSSGRQERFNPDKLAQTVSRSGVPYLMARDIAKKTTKKIKSRAIANASNRSSKSNAKATTRKRVVVTASQMRNLVAGELRQRNRPDIASSYTGKPPEHLELQIKPSINDKEPILDNVAANRTRILFDPSKQKGSS